MRNNKGKFIVILTVSLFLCFLTACSNAQVTEISPTKKATITSVPTKEALAIQDASTATPSPTNVKTATVTISVSATPRADLGTLMNWSENEALSLINSIDFYARTVNSSEKCVYWPECISSQLRIYFEAQEAVDIALREAFYRFPSIANREELEWKLALSNAILGRGKAPEKQVINLLNQGLNSGDLAIENLTEKLLLYGFSVLKALPVTNLFGNGQDGLVFLISVDGAFLGSVERGGTDGIIVAIKQEDNGSFEVFEVDSEWLFGYWTSFDFYPEDLTGDNQPEIITESTISSGGPRDLRLNVMSFIDGHFVSIMPNAQRLVYPSLDLEISWEIVPGENGKLPTIQVTQGAIAPGRIITEIYAWNNEILELVNRQVHPYQQFSCPSLYGLPYFDLEIQIDMVDVCLSEWPTSESESLGPSYPDYLRFYLAMLQLSQSQEEVIATLESLINSPVNPDNLTVSLAAQAYLDNFENRGDMYRACHSAILVMNETLDPDESNYSQLIEKWGYDPPPPMPDSICSESDAIVSIVDYWNSRGLAQTQSISNLLEQAGVTTLMQEVTDLDENGLDDLIAVVPSYSLWGLTYDVWIFLNYQSTIIPLDAMGFYFDDETPAQEITIETYIPIRSNLPVHVIYAEDRLLIFQISPENKSGFLRVLLKTRDVESFSVDQVDQNFLVTVLFNDTVANSTLSGEVFDWDIENQELVLSKRLATNSLGENLEDVALRAEMLLLDHKKPMEAIPLLETLLLESEADFYYSRSRLYYLLGLAYELTGNEQEATNTYRELVQNYPESPYAIMAQAKLGD